MTDSYEDILNLPRPVSGRHPRMPIEDRAAQFAPFSALSGYEDAIREAAKQAEEPLFQDMKTRSGRLQSRRKRVPGMNMEPGRFLIMMIKFDNSNTPHYYI